MSRIALLLFFCTPLVVACRSQSPPAADSAPTVIAQWSGQRGGASTPGTRIVRTAEEWDAFWRQVEQTRPRPLDTAREMAVVIHLGEKRTGGYGAYIVQLRVEEGKLLVEYRTSAPEPGTMVTQELTSPWVAALVPKSVLPVVFKPVGAASRSRREK